MPVLTPEEYRKRASEIYDPSYAVKVANENSAFNNTMAQYQNQGNMINSEFDRSIQANARNTAMNQNQFNNNTLSRGMARSSVATTGLAGIQNTGNRVAGEIEQDRVQKIDNLETLKTNLRANLESSLKALSNEREGGINSMAMQLQQRDEDIQRQLDQQAEEKRRYDQEWNFKQEQAAKDETYRQQQLSLSKKSSGGSSGGSSSKSSTKIYQEAAGDIEYILKNGRKDDAQLYIRDAKGSWLTSGMTAAQLKALQDYVDSYYYTPEENAQYRKKTYNQRPATEGL